MGTEACGARSTKWQKTAVVSVARKLAVLHRLWVSGEVYEPLRNSQKAMRGGLESFDPDS
jgi:hypothetical protein